MIPVALCLHYWPMLRQRCDAGLRAPHDCEGCPAYYDGTRHAGPEPGEAKRAAEWAALRSGPGVHVPHARFRGQP